MSGFRPTRASPPAKRTVVNGRVGPTPTSDLSRSSAVSTSELQGLTPQDIEFIDAVIQRASPSSTTFLSVFKAYNDILNERGMDPQNEVTYYGKLLKLGTLKGGSWGDKWIMIKDQQGYEEGKGSHIEPRQPRTILRTTPMRTATRLTPKGPDDDVFTIHSHQEETETEAGDDTEIVAPQYHRTPRSILRQPLAGPLSTATDSLGPYDSPPSVPSSVPPPPRRQIVLPPASVPRPWDNVSDATDEVRTPSTTPPSYGAAVRDSHLFRQTPVINHSRAYVERPTSTPAVPKHAPAQPRQRAKSLINEEDAWSKITMLRDEKEADRFREDRLVERCWEVWKSGFDWIIVRYLGASLFIADLLNLV